ncbi:hypothetical protein [Cerasicoccus maritimus]|uniref:hypothetical protein n=1 Tax=Cerasicoccus maritimus TaxID=490089 RepID=UPI002852A1BB|nr:hypothetical protein [Cerasicoccus maritimus]
MHLTSLRQWLKSSQAEDAWWVCVDVNLHDSVITLKELESILAKTAGKQVSVLHVSECNLPEEPWKTLDPLTTALAAESSGLSKKDWEKIENRLLELESQQDNFKKRLELMERTIEVLGQPVRQALQIIEERKNHVEKAEQVLSDRAWQYETFIAEVEQLKDDLRAAGIAIPGVLVNFNAV